MTRNTTRKGVPISRKTEMEVDFYIHLWERREFKEYVEVLASVFRPGEFLTIREIHKRLGRRVLPHWTFDAIEYGEFEAKGVLPTRFRKL